MGFVSIPPDHGAIESVRAGRQACRARLTGRANFSKAAQRSARSACRMPSTLAFCAVVELGGPRLLASRLARTLAPPERLN